MLLMVVVVVVMVVVFLVDVLVEYGGIGAVGEWAVHVRIG